jgi:sugar phosphate isomerase/epimerase
MATEPGYIESLKDVPVETTNLFFSSDLRLYENESRSIKAAERTIRRAAELGGVQIMVVGSGAARKSAPNREADWCFVRFVEILNQANRNTKDCTIVLAPESLNRDETDVGNDLAQLAHSLHEVGLGYTADSYHVLKEWDYDGRQSSLEDLFKVQVPFAPNHVHLGPLTRKAPKADDPMLLAFFQRLKEFGYDGRISLECSWDNIKAELKPSIEATQILWEAA